MPLLLALCYKSPDLPFFLRYLFLPGMNYHVVLMADAVERCCDWHVPILK